MQLHVTVKKTLVPEDSRRDFVFNRRGQAAPSIMTVPFVTRQERRMGILDLQTRRKKMRLLQELGASTSTIQQFIPTDQVPIRRYFHSRTNAPMLYGDWDVDSDDEPDETWLNRMSEEVRS
jgi:hypothetical protein